MVLVGGLWGCASVVPREFTTSEREMQAALSSRFPLQQKVLDICSKTPVTKTLLRSLEINTQLV